METHQHEISQQTFDQIVGIGLQTAGLKAMLSILDNYLPAPLYHKVSGQLILLDGSVNELIAKGYTSTIPATSSDEVDDQALNDLVTPEMQSQWADNERKYTSQPLLDDDDNQEESTESDNGPSQTAAMAAKMVAAAEPVKTDVSATEVTPRPVIKPSYTEDQLTEYSAKLKQAAQDSLSKQLAHVEASTASDDDAASPASTSDDPDDDDVFTKATPDDAGDDGNDDTAAAASGAETSDPMPTDDDGDESDGDNTETDTDTAAKPSGSSSGFGGSW